MDALNFVPQVDRLRMLALARTCQAITLIALLLAGPCLILAGVYCPEAAPAVVSILMTVMAVGLSLIVLGDRPGVDCRR